MALTQVSPGLLNAEAQAQGFRNRIINGDMRIDQRNAGAAVASDGSFAVDRFYNVNTTDGSFSAQQDSSAPAGFTNSLKFTITAADSSLTGTQILTVQQRIEGYNISDLAWGTASAKTVTLSFWVRSSLTGTFGGSITNSAVNRTYPFTYSISAADTWEQKSVTIPGDTTGTWLTTNGIGIRVYFSLGSGPDRSGTAEVWSTGVYTSATGATSVVGTNGATLYITGVQLEVGSVATEFERRPYGTELALCQRYYFSINPTSSASCIAFGSAAQTTTVFVGFAFPVEMRSSPSYSSSGSISNYKVSDGNSGVTVSSTVLQSATNKYARVQFTPSSSLTQFRPYWLEPQNDATTLGFSSEL